MSLRIAIICIAALSCANAQTANPSPLDAVCGVWKVEREISIGKPGSAPSPLIGERLQYSSTRALIGKEVIVESPEYVRRSLTAKQFFPYYFANAEDLGLGDPVDQIRIFGPKRTELFGPGVMLWVKNSETLLMVSHGTFYDLKRIEKCGK